MPPSKALPGLRLERERESGQEQIKKQSGLRETKAEAGDEASEGRIEGIRQELSTVASCGPRRESWGAWRSADRWWLMLAIWPTKPVRRGRLCWSGFYHQVNWPLHKAQYMPCVPFCNGLHCLEECVCEALKSSTFSSVLARACVCTHLTVHPFMSVFVSRHLYVSEGVSIFARRRLRAYLLLHQCLCACRAPWRRLLALAILRRGRCHFSQWQAVAHAGVAPGLQTNSVWLQSLFFSVFASADHRPRSLQEPRQRNGLGRGSACLRLTEEDHTPSWARKRPRLRDRHAKTKFNWFTPYTDQGMAL